MKTKKIAKKLITLVLAATMILGCSITVFADATSRAELVNNIKHGQVQETSQNGKPLSSDMVQKLQSMDMTVNTYKKEDGNYYGYRDLVGGESTGETYGLQINMINELTRGEKKRFLEDVFTVANYSAGTGTVTTQDVQDFYNALQNQEGMGSALLASIMGNTKPDYASANKILTPFNGLVGTIIGILVVGMMTLLSLTMVLDIAYITIPAFTLLCDGGDSGSGGMGGGNQKKGFLGGLVSKAAHNALDEKNGGGMGGNSMGGGDNKYAIGEYFKHRVVELVLLGICLLYLAQGQIFAGVAGILDLFSGFLGF